MKSKRRRGAEQIGMLPIERDDECWSIASRIDKMELKSKDGKLKGGKTAEKRN